MSNWCLAEDCRALALNDCGCGEPVLSVVVRQNGPVIEMTFSHPADAMNCRLAFDMKDYRPLTYQEYNSILGLEVD